MARFLEILGLGTSGEEGDLGESLDVCLNLNNHIDLNLLHAQVNRISEQPVVMKDKVLNQNPQASEVRQLYQLGGVGWADPSMTFVQGTLGPPSQSDAYVDDVLRNSQDLEILMGCCQTFMARFEEA